MEIFNKSFIDYIKKQPGMKAWVDDMNERIALVKKSMEKPKRIVIRGKRLGQNRKIKTMLDENFAGDWIYVGDGKVKIGYPPISPDYICNYGEKKVLLRKSRHVYTAHFVKHGFRVLVLNENEKDIESIKNFI